MSEIKGMVSVKSVSDRACFLRVCCCRRVYGFVQEVGYPSRLSLACVVKIASVWCVVDEYCMARWNSLRTTVE